MTYNVLFSAIICSVLDNIEPYLSGWSRGLLIEVVPVLDPPFRSDFFEAGLLLYS